MAATLPRHIERDPPPPGGSVIFPAGTILRYIGSA